MTEIRYTDKRGGAFTKQQLQDNGQWSEIYQKPIWNLSDKERKVELKNSKQRARARTKAIRKFGEVNVNNPRR